MNEFQMVFLFVRILNRSRDCIRFDEDVVVERGFLDDAAPFFPATDADGLAAAVDAAVAIAE